MRKGIPMADVSIYRYIPHRRTQQKLKAPTPPVKVMDQLPHGNPAARSSRWRGLGSRLAR